MTETADILSKVLEHIIQSVVMYDNNKRLQVWNDRYAKILQFPEGMLEVGRDNRDLAVFLARRGDYGPGDPDTLAQKRLDTLWSGRNSRTEIVIRNTETYDVLAQPTADGWLVITYTDITERKKAELALRESDERFRDFAASGSDWYWELDKDLNYTWVSETLIGGEEAINSNWLVGKNRIERMADTMIDAEGLRQHADDLRSQRPFRNFEYQLTPELYVAVTGQPILDSTGNFAGYRGVGRDITDRVLDQQKIAHQRDALAEANAQKSKFFSIVAHDLKNPFNVMIGYADMIDQMGSELDREKLLEIAHSISSTSRSLYQLLEDLLAWGQTQMRANTLDPKLVKIVDLFNLATNNLKAAADAKRIALNLKACDTELVVDTDRISAVIRNLVSNAIKFTPEEGDIFVAAETFLTDDGTGEVVISVSDSGIGISPENLDRLFRLDAGMTTSGTRGEQGTGLGLILCKELVEQHGGTISATSTLGEGTTFSFSLPYEPAAVSLDQAL